MTTYTLTPIEVTGTVTLTAAQVNSKRVVCKGESGTVITLPNIDGTTSIGQVTVVNAGTVSQDVAYTDARRNPATKTIPAGKKRHFSATKGGGAGTRWFSGDQQDASTVEQDEERTTSAVVESTVVSVLVARGLTLPGPVRASYTAELAETVIDANDCFGSILYVTPTTPKTVLALPAADDVGARGRFTLIVAEGAAGTTVEVGISDAVTYLNHAFTSLTLTPKTVVEFSSNGTGWRAHYLGQLNPNGGIELTPTYASAGSFQVLAADLNAGSGVGTSGPGDTDFIAAIMGNILGAGLSKTANYLAGVIGAYTITGVKATTYPSAGVMGIVGDTVTELDAAVLAVLDGDSGLTKVEAMFGVMSNNSTPASGADFGLDLQSAAHDGYLPIDSAFYKKGIVRLVEDVVFMVGTATPTDGVAGTGAGVSGPGSLHLNTSDKKLRINTNTKASPTWTIVGTQA